MSMVDVVAEVIETVKEMTHLVIDSTTYVIADKESRDRIGVLEGNPDLPNYWDEYLPERIAEIKSLQDAGGKDCFSFIVMTDMHYPSNLGKNSPKLAARILNEINAKYVLCLGDMQTRGCHQTKEALEAENAEIEDMFAPIRKNLLMIEGNHDGSYGLLDRDGDGAISNKNADGTTKPANERESYVYNLTPEEMHERIYRKVGLVGDVHFDESGSAYYVDDTANKVRYIMLNTHCNDYELQEDGTAKYPTMWVFRFTQSQFDFLTNEALVNGLTDSWSVVVCAHAPITQEIGDRDIMTGVLNAYKNKATYSGVYEGSADGAPAYTNLTEPLPDNTTDTSKWVNGYRISSSSITAQAGTTISNYITCNQGDVIRIKGVTLRENSDRLILCYTHNNGTYNEGKVYWNTTGHSLFNCELIDGVYTITLKNPEDYGFSAIRFSMPTPENANAVIVTVNEEIALSEYGYDFVSVNADFTGAKGELVGYFHGHTHIDSLNTSLGINVIGTRCDGHEENDATLKAEKVAGTVTEQSFDVFTVNTKTRKIYATKIGAGDDRVISY